VPRLITDYSDYSMRGGVRQGVSFHIMKLPRIRTSKVYGKLPLAFIVNRSPVVFVNPKGAHLTIEKVPT